MLNKLRTFFADMGNAIRIGGALDNGRIGETEIREAVATVAARSVMHAQGAPKASKLEVVKAA